MGDTGEKLAAAAPTGAVPDAAAAPAGGAPAEPPSNSALYVGDLDKDLNETDLYDLFNEAGPVHSIRVCRDTVTRRSLGYAYVNYNVGVDPDAAKNAMDQLNYREVKGKPIRIMWANRGTTERRKEGNIFIKNLEKNITTRLLHDTFSSFGKILSCKVALDQDNQSKGYGFVQFESLEAAQAAIDGVNGMTLGDESDKVVTVTWFVNRSERGDSSRKRFTNLYVKNLPASVATEDDLKKLFSEYGTISSAVLTTNASTGKPFGFVNFDTPESAAAAKAALHDSIHDGSQLYVDRAQSKTERSELLRQRQETKRTEQQEAMEGRNVYVKNLPEAFDDSALRELFKSFGEIDNAKIMRDAETQLSRGFGFVLFKTPESAQAAVQSLHAQPLPSVNGEPSNGKLLYVAFAQNKQLRAQTLENMAKVKAMQAGGPMGGQARGMAGPVPGMPGMPGMPGAMAGYMAGGYPGMMPFANGRGMMPMSPMYPGMMAGMPGGGRGIMGGQGGGRGGMMPMNPAMMGPINPAMMPMGPAMMGMANGMGGGRSAGRVNGSRGGGGRMGGGALGGGRGQMTPGRGGMGSARGMGPRAGMPAGPSGAMMQQRGAMPMGPAAPEEAPIELSLTNKLRVMSEEEQKQHLGELLFPRIQGMLQQRFSPENSEKLASKVTGMFLEMDTSGLLYLLDTDNECHAKINEALEVLRAHGAMPEGCE